MTSNVCGLSGANNAPIQDDVMEAVAGLILGSIPEDQIREKFRLPLLDGGDVFDRMVAAGVASNRGDAIRRVGNAFPRPKSSRWLALGQWVVDYTKEFSKTRQDHFVAEPLPIQPIASAPKRSPGRSLGILAADPLYSSEA